MRLTAFYTFPDHLLADILAYDPDLRVRWDDQEACIRVERKVTRSADVSPRFFSRPRDRQSAVERYALIYRLNPGQEHAILPRLHADDMWRRGGARIVMSEAEAAEAARSAAWKARMADDHRAKAREIWRHINTPKVAREGAMNRPFLGTGRGESLD